MKKPLNRLGLITEGGTVDIILLSERLQLPLSETALMLGTTIESVLGQKLGSSVQAAALKLAMMLDELSEALGRTEYASYWLRTPQRELGGEMPIAWLQRGHIDDVISYVDAFVQMRPD